MQGIVEQEARLQPPRIHTPAGKFPDFRQLLEKYAKQGVWVKISDSWDETADCTGCDPEVVKATIDEYNSFCDRGYDEDFAIKKINM